MIYMMAFKQFSMALFTAIFVLGLLFDILTREMPDVLRDGSDLRIEEAQQLIAHTFSSTFAIDSELAASQP